MTSRTPSPVEKVFAAAFYAPIGLGAKLVDDLPTNLTKAKQHIDFARSIGRIAVDRGVAEVTAKLRDSTGDITDTHDRSMVIDVEVVEDRDETIPEGPVPDVEGLALADYDHLPASHIISKLDGLTSGEVGAIERYEVANRGRRTVLGKIDQLRQESA